MVASCGAAGDEHKKRIFWLGLGLGKELAKKKEKTLRDTRSETLRTLLSRCTLIILSFPFFPSRFILWEAKTNLGEFLSLTQRSKAISDTDHYSMSKDDEQFPDKLFTWEEIRKHNKDTDCWVVMYGKVVDITKFLTTHPGGLDPINDMGGFDLTNQFEARGHSEKADRIWRKYVIGRVDPNSVPPKVVPKAPRGGLADKPVVADPKAKKDGSSTLSLPVVFFVIAVVCATSFFVLYRSAE